MKTVINNTEWEIKLVSPTSQNLQRSDGVYTFGVTDNCKRTIYISNILNDYMFIKVLTHELVHAFCFANNYLVNLETEETIADFFSLFGKDIIYTCNDIVGIYYNNIKKL